MLSYFQILLGNRGKGTKSGFIFLRLYQHYMGQETCEQSTMRERRYERVKVNQEGDWKPKIRQIGRIVFLLPHKFLHQIYEMGPTVCHEQYLTQEQLYLLLLQLRFSRYFLHHWVDVLWCNSCTIGEAVPQRLHYPESSPQRVKDTEIQRRTLLTLNALSIPCSSTAQERSPVGEKVVQKGDSE